MKKALLAILLAATCSMAWAQGKEKEKGQLVINGVVGYEVSGLNAFRISHVIGVQLGADVLYHIPFRDDWGLQIGLGYKFHCLQFQNPVRYNEEADALEFYTPQTERYEANELYWHTIEIPLLLCWGDGEPNVYFGLRPGMNFAPYFRHSQRKEIDPTSMQGEVTNTYFTAGNMLNQFSLPLILGSEGNLFTKSSVTTTFGVELYVNLLPTVLAVPEGERRFHTWGFNVKL